MAGVELKNIKGILYLSVGDAVTLARMAHSRKLTAEQLANAFSQLMPKKPKPKKKRSPRGRRR